MIRDLSSTPEVPVVLTGFESAHTNFLEMNALFLQVLIVGCGKVLVVHLAVSGHCS